MIFSHQWKELATLDKVCKFGWEPLRVCIICGRAQKRETYHLWMRVVSYKWEPLVGRCPGKHDPNELGIEVKSSLLKEVGNG